MARPMGTGRGFPGVRVPLFFALLTVGFGIQIVAAWLIGLF